MVEPDLEAHWISRVKYILYISEDCKKNGCRRPRGLQCANAPGAIVDHNQRRLALWEPGRAPLRMETLQRSTTRRARYGTEVHALKLPAHAHHLLFLYSHTGECCVKSKTASAVLGAN